MGVMSSSVYSPGTTVRRACRFPGYNYSSHLEEEKEMTFDRQAIVNV